MSVQDLTNKTEWPLLKDGSLDTEQLIRKYDLADEIALIKRGTIEVLPHEELVRKLVMSRESGEPLRVKFGADPTAPDIHLGHTVVLQKLRVFQELGHKIVFIIGDFTAGIGDPSGRNKTRPPLSAEAVKANALTYQEQAGKVLNMNKVELVYNSRWFDAMSFKDVIALSSKYTVARLLERDDFSKRYSEGTAIYLHEFLYPLAQGYDSVYLKADIEIGGSDQKFNLLVARELQREYGQSPQVILTMPLLEGTDGHRKMSKSYNNYIGLHEPANEMFGKIMSISDELMWRYYELLSRLTMAEIAKKKKMVANEKLHPKQAKVELAKELVSLYHCHDLADRAAAEFDRVFRKKDLPDDIPLHHFIDGKHTIIDTICETISSVGSKSAARRLIKQGGVSLDGEKVNDIDATFILDANTSKHLLKVGKRNFARIIMKKENV